MRALAIVMLLSAPALAEPVRAPTCEAAGLHVAQVIAGDSRAVASRCEHDRWSSDARMCFALAATVDTAQRCLDTLSKLQRSQLAGDVDRLAVTTARRNMERWLARRPLALVPASRPTQFQLASMSPDDEHRARTLRAQGMTAYRAGKFDVAIRKLTAANDADPEPELLYHLAQSYRLTGDRAAALELYEKYIDIAPHGPAAADCRQQIEQLDDLP